MSHTRPITCPICATVSHLCTKDCCKKSFNPGCDEGVPTEQYPQYFSAHRAVLPFFEKYKMGFLPILTDRGTEYCGKADHDYQLDSAINNIDYTKTKEKSPQTNSIRERFHRTILNEFYQIIFRKKIDRTLAELQDDLDEWIKGYNHDRSHQGKTYCGQMPMATLENEKTIWIEKADVLNSNEVVGQSIAC